MRVIADSAGHQIIQVDRNQPLGEGVDTSGRYSIPVPEGVPLRVGPQSVVLPDSDPNSVVGQSYAGLLAHYPQFSNVLFNPLLVPTDMDELDPTGVLKEGTPVTATHQARFQMGRQTGGLLPAGATPVSVAMLPSNDSGGPGFERPGVIVTTTLDIGPYTANIGAAEFAVYWYVYEMVWDEDIRTNFGAFAGQNTPSLKRLVEVDQEESTFEVFLSINGGANFLEVDRLLPVAFCEPGRYIRMAFKNVSSVTKRYLAAYALLF